MEKSIENDKSRQCEELLERIAELEALLEDNEKQDDIAHISKATVFLCRVPRRGTVTF